MMGFDTQVRLSEEHRKDYLRQADQFRLVKQALAGSESRASLRMYLLQWFGQQLIEIGCFLKRHFGRQARTSVNTLALYPCEDRA
jgi:hypothetical protein